MRVHDKESAAWVDAQSTASVLLEWTEYDVGVRFDLLKCLALYHSKELQAQVKRFVLKPKRSFRQDNPLPPSGR